MTQQKGTHKEGLEVIRNLGGERSQVLYSLYVSCEFFWKDVNRK